MTTVKEFTESLPIVLYRNTIIRKFTQSPDSNKVIYSKEFSSGNVYESQMTDTDAFELFINITNYQK